MEALEKEGASGDTKALAAPLKLPHDSSSIVGGNRASSTQTTISYAEFLEGKSRISIVGQPSNIDDPSTQQTTAKLVNSAIASSNGGLQSSYANIVKGTNQATRVGSSRPSFEAPKFVDPTSICRKPTTTQGGISSIVFTSTEKKQLVDNLNWVLIGKFSHGRPQLQVIQQFFNNLQLQGEVNCALADSKHVYIECTSYLNYYMIWLQLVWIIQGFSMRMFKWQSDFSVAVESPIAPVWIKIVGLPLYFFDEYTLLSVASAVGKPIKVDVRNINRSCLSYARICIELDVSQPLVETIVINFVDDNTEVITETKKVTVCYDVVPQYCPVCAHIGHSPVNCKRPKLASTLELNSGKSLVSIRNSPAATVSWQGGVKKIWQPVSNSVLEQSIVAQPIKGVANDQGRTSAGVAGPLIVAGRISAGVAVQPGVAEPDAGCADAGVAVQILSTSNSFDVLQVQGQEKGAVLQQVSDTKHAEVAVLQQVFTPLLQNDTPLLEDVAMQSPPQVQGREKGAVLQQVLDTKHADVAVLQQVSDKAEVTPLLQNDTQLLEDVAMQTPTRPTRTDTVRPKSADSALGKKKAMVQLRQLGPCKTVEQTHTKHPTKASWADEVEALEKQESQASRMAIEHSFKLARYPKEGYYKNWLVLNVPAFQEMTLQQQKETTATIMADFYQWKVTSVLEEELRKDFVLREAPDSEKGWQVVTHKKKRSPSDNTTPKEKSPSSKVTTTSDTTKGRQENKAGRAPSLDPDYDIEQLHARIQKMKRDSPQKRQLQYELKLLRGA